MFEVGNRVWNNGNHDRKTIGIITRVIDAQWCEVLWSQDNGYVYTGTIRRDGVVDYGLALEGRGADRIVRVDLSVRIRQEV